MLDKWSVVKGSLFSRHEDLQTETSAKRESRSRSTWATTAVLKTRAGGSRGAKREKTQTTLGERRRTSIIEVDYRSFIGEVRRGMGRSNTRYYKAAPGSRRIEQLRSKGGRRSRYLGVDTAAAKMLELVFKFGCLHVLRYVAHKQAHLFRNIIYYYYLL